MTVCLAGRVSPTRPRTGRPTSPISARGCASATHSSRRRSVPTAIYDYAVIRAVPRVEREEFVNVGVIVSCQSTGLLERSEGHTSELQSLMRNSYAVFCLKKQNAVTHK